MCISHVMATGRVAVGRAVAKETVETVGTTVGVTVGAMAVVTVSAMATVATVAVAKAAVSEGKRLRAFFAIWYLG